MRPCVVVTGATGELGAFVMAALRGVDVDVIATRHRRDPNGIGDASTRWVPFSLDAPRVAAEWIPRDRPLLVLHLACTVSAEMGTVFRVDCRGTEALAAIVAEAAGDAPVAFVFASSIAATDTSCNYGIGKAYLEQRLRARATETLRVASVRIPFVGKSTRPEIADIAPERFVPALFQAIDFAGTLAELGANRPASRAAYDQPFVSLDGAVA